MRCKIPWSLEFMWDQFTHTFYNNEFLQHRARILFEKEKTLLPTTQHKLYCEKLRREVGPLEDILMFYNGEKSIPSYIQDIKQRVEEIRKVIGYNQRSMKDATKKVDAILRGCTMEGCNGFITRLRHQCGVCSARICPACHITLTEGGEKHTCKQEDVDTAKLLTQNTKSCPKCREMIYKIDGCDQMWCTMCQTAFSWKTGEIESNIHNPHYYEWMRRVGQEIPRADEVQPCGEARPDLRRIVTVHTETPDQKDLLYMVHRIIGHIQYSEIPKVERMIEQSTGDMTKEHMRVCYLRNELTEQDWKHMICLSQKRDEKWRAIQVVFELFNRVAIEQLNQVVNAGVMDRDMFRTFLASMNGIRNYCNEVFLGMKTKFQMAPYYINENLTINRGTVLVPTEITVVSL